MMILSLFSFLLPISSIFLGYEIICAISRQRLSKIEALSLSFPIGLILSSFSGLIFSLVLFCSFLNFVAQVCIAFSLGIIIKLYTAKSQTKRNVRHFNIMPASYFFVLFCVFAFSFMSSTALFAKKDEIIRTGDNDMLYEIAMIASFTKGVNKRSNFLTGFTVNIVSNLKTYTEVAVPFYSALLKESGASLRDSILIPSILLFASICFLSFFYIYRVTNNQFIACFAVPSVFLIGGVGFTALSINNNKSNESVDFIFFFGGNDVCNWGHPLLHNYLTSRINLASLAISLSVYLLLEVDLYHAAGIISIFCYFVRPQSGFALLLAFLIYKYDQIRTRVQYYGIPFLIMSFLFLRRFQKTTPLWTSDIAKSSFFPPLSFLFHIYGFAIFCLPFAMRKTTYFRVLTPLLIFYLLAYIKLQEDHRFNFFTSQAVVTPLIVAAISCGISYLMELCTNEELSGVLLAFVFLLYSLLWFSSLAGIYYRLFLTIKVFSEEGNDVARWIAQNTPRNSVFAAPSKLNWNPAIVRAGRINYVGNLQALQDFPVNTTYYETQINVFVNNPDHKIEADYFIFEKEDAWEFSILKSQMLKIEYSNSKYYVLTWN